MINKFAITVANGNCILSCAATDPTGFFFLPVKHLFCRVKFLITSVWGLDSVKKGGKLISLARMGLGIVSVIGPVGCIFIIKSKLVSF